MKQLFLSAAIALLSVSAMAQNTIKPLAIGTPVPAADVKLKTVDGGYISLGEVKSKNGLLVMFSCNTCPYVIKSQARTMQVMKMSKELNIPMIIINSNDAQRGEADSYEAMKAYAKQQGYFVPYALDEQSKIANLFGATRTPEVFLFDAGGKLVYEGAMEDNPSDPGNSKRIFLVDAMKKLNTSTAIDPATTRSIGCTIKRSM